MSRLKLSLRGGFTLSEVMVALTILTVAILGVAKLSSTSLRFATRARMETQNYGDAQQVVDSLMSLGFGNSSLVSGSATVRGRSISWTVGSSASAPQLLTIKVNRPGYQKFTTTGTDTIIVYLSKWTPGA